MKLQIYDKELDRILTEEELEGQYYYTGELDRNLPDPMPDIKEFKFNLVTLKVQTDMDNACSDEDCCTPCEMFCDDERFQVHFILPTEILK